MGALPSEVNELVDGVGELAVVIAYLSGLGVLARLL
jgi:hypothetical protein